MYTKREKVSIENTRLIYKTNFSGDPARDTFGSDKRRINVVIPTDALAQHLIDLGVNVKQTRPNPERTYDEPFQPTWFVPVTINMESKWPPRVFWITPNGRKISCNIDTIGQLDYIRIKNVNAFCTLVEKRNHPGEFSLYADVLYIEQDLDSDPYANRYAYLDAAPEGDLAEPSGQKDLPF